MVVIDIHYRVAVKPETLLGILHKAHPAYEGCAFY